MVARLRVPQADYEPESIATTPKTPKAARPPRPEPREMSAVALRRCKRRDDGRRGKRPMQPPNRGRKNRAWGPSPLGHADSPMRTRPRALDGPDALAPPEAEMGVREAPQSVRRVIVSSASHLHLHHHHTTTAITIPHPPSPLTSPLSLSRKLLPLAGLSATSCMSLTCHRPCPLPLSLRNYKPPDTQNGGVCEGTDLRHHL